MLLMTGRKPRTNSGKGESDNVGSTFGDAGDANNGGGPVARKLHGTLSVDRLVMLDSASLSSAGVESRFLKLSLNHRVFVEDSIMENMVYIVILDSAWEGEKVMAAFCSYEGAMEYVQWALEDNVDGEVYVRRLCLED